MVEDLPADVPDNEKFNKLHPAMLAHVDQSYDGAWKLVDMLKTPEAIEADLAANCKKGRFV